MHDAVVIMVKASGSDVPNVSTLAGKKFSSDREEQSAEIAEYVSQEIQVLGKKSVLIQGEPTVLTAEIVRIQNAVGSALDAEQPILIAVEH
jgi:hypothetical protein